MNKQYYLSNKRMKTTFYLYSGFFVFTVIAFVITFSPIFLIAGIVFLLLSLFFYGKNKKVLQLEIGTDHILYHEKKSFGSIKYRDFYNLFINTEFDKMPISNIKGIEKSTSFINGNTITIITTGGTKIRLLLDENVAQINAIYTDLQHIVKTNELTNPSEKKVVEIKNEGYTKKIIREKKGNKIITNTITTFDHTPKIENSLLISETITGILVLMKKIDPSLEISDTLATVHTLDTSHQEKLAQLTERILAADIYESKEIMKSKVTSCNKEYTRNEIQYLFKTSLLPTKGHFGIHPKIDSLFKEMLILADYDELGLDNAIIQLRT